jgi:hypothetical protein
MGSVWSMTPVDITSISNDDCGDEEGARRVSVAWAIAHASARPFQPVTAFVQLLLTMRAHARPAICSRTDLEMVTDAAWNALWVKVAAGDVRCKVENASQRPQLHYREKRD